MKIVLVIPAYNEAAYIGDCLELATRQKRPFDQIIVVDNNSRDRTTEIARSYPGVLVLSEERQGQAYARNHGFDYAYRRGADILCRIDADTHLPSNWTMVVEQYFSNAAHDSVIGITGPVRIYDSPLHSLLRLESIAIAFLTRHLLGSVFLIGCHTIIRAEAWPDVHALLVDEGAQVHEDMTLSYVAARCGKVAFVPALHAFISCRTYLKRPKESFRYVRRWVYSFYYLHLG
jgi:glycosyltransferase involved in cell wall biosynthesis